MKRDLLPFVVEPQLKHAVRDLAQECGRRLRQVAAQPKETRAVALHEHARTRERG